MINNKKTLLIIPIIAIIFLIPQITFSQEDTNNNLYCVTASLDPDTGCFPIQEHERDDLANACDIIISTDEYESNPCEEVCCCDSDEETSYPAAYCTEELEGKITSRTEDKTCETICNENEDVETSSLILTIKNQEDDVINTGKYYLYIGEDKENLVYKGDITSGTTNINNIPQRDDYFLLVTTIETRDEEEYICKNQAEINLDGTKEMELILDDCEVNTDSTDPAETDDECEPIWIYEYEDNNNCGEIIDVVDTNNCGEDIPQDMYNRIGDEDPCVDLYNPMLCGNNELDEGEECDWIDENGEYEFTSTCEDKGFESGQLRCTNCLIQTDFCSNCPTDVSECAETMCDCEICEDEAVCNPTTCDPNEEDIELNIETSYEEEASLILQWDAPQICLDDSSVTIYRKKCSIDDKTCDVSFNKDNELKTVESEPRYYEDKTITDTRYYCYAIKLKSNDDNFELESEEVCERLPDQECIGRDNEESFCLDNKITQCIDGYLTEGQDCEDDKCINSINQDARCVSADICDACSGPFGLFGFVIYDSAFVHSSEMGCDEAEDENICFREDHTQRLTSAGQFNHCTNVNSCYDYKTKGSCERDTCALVEEDDGCEWEPLYGDELGMGVCTPNNVEDQNCNFCDENPATGGYCSEDLCELYGEDCYYNSNPDKSDDGFAINKYYCNNEEEVGCETYNTQEQCEGNEELIIDVKYFKDDYNHLNAFEGTNEIITSSNDELQRGVCVWIENENKCIRDADYKTSEDDNYSDCDEDNKNCLLDFETPNTTIKINGNEIENGGTYSTRQLFKQGLIIINTTESVRTRYSIYETETDFIYPNLTFSEFAHYVEDELHKQQDISQDYTISYFSKDASNNLEEVQTKNINLLTQLAINVNHTIESEYDPTSKTVLSDVTIEAEGISQDEFTCTGELKSLSEGVIGTELTRSTNNGEIQWTYNPLADGSYKFNITCSDEYNQETNQEYEFEIEEDNIISNPTPKLKTYNKESEIELSIDTMSEASCSYESVFPSGLTGNFDSDSDRTKHEVLLNNMQEGVYIIRPMCTFEDETIGENGEYRGNAGDLITFGIDKTAPELTIYDRDQGLPEEPAKYNSTLFPAETLKLEFVCDDESSNLQYNGFDFSFGCEEDIDYEVEHEEYVISETEKAYVKLASIFSDRTGITINESGSIESGNAKTFRAPDTYKLVTLKLDVTDKGGNTQSHEIPLRLRNLEHSVPSIEICNPETQICS